MNDISRLSNLSCSVVSHQLQILKDAGVVCVRQEGTKTAISWILTGIHSADSQRCFPMHRCSQISFQIAGANKTADYFTSLLLIISDCKCSPTSRECSFKCMGNHWKYYEV